MKKAIMIVTLLLGLASVDLYAGDGSSCLQAIQIDTAYSGTLAAGEYWFMAETPALPIVLYFYPENETDPAPEITLDLTCESGVYADPEVARMVSLAENYGLSFPMVYKPKAQFDSNDKLVYLLTFDESYRNMLFSEGVTYAIPAYMHLISKGSGQLKIVSNSTFSQCTDNVNTLGMNTALRFLPEDSINTYIWPIGEWIHDRYRITWEGDDKLEMFTGEDCTVTRTRRVRNYYVLPDDHVTMTPSRASDWIKDLFQTDLYVKLYARSEGVLRVTSYEEKAEIKEMVLLGIPAVINHEALTISCTLPKGTNRTTAIRTALENLNDRTKESYIIYTAYEGEVPEKGDNRYATLKFGDKTYNLGGIVAAKETGSTDASLAAIKINGVTLADFNPSQLIYDEVEVDNADFTLEVETNNSLATVSVKRATSVPGKTEITVTSEVGNSQVYVLNMIVTRSRNTNLASITVDGEPLSGFTPEQLYYRMYAMSIPLVEAVAEDSKSEIVIDQAKGVPGFAQIFVTAEAGNRQSYSINFTIDPRVLECAGSAVGMEINAPVELKKDSDMVVRVPIGKPSLDADSTNWAGQRIAFTWSGQKNLNVYIGTTCLFDPSHPDKTQLDSFTVAVPKGETRSVYYMTAQQTLALGKQSIDGSLYLRFKMQEDGSLAATNWDPDCTNTPTFIDLNTEIYLPAGHNSENVYKFYMPDWENRSIKLSWEGADGIRIWAAWDCEFKLLEKISNGNTSIQPFIDRWELQATGSETFTIAESNELKRKCKLRGSDFLYIRFGVEGYPGYFKTEVVGGAPYTQLGNVAKESTLQWTRVEEGIEISSSSTQYVTVFNMQGMRVAQWQLQAGESRVLPRGMYIICGETETGKVGS